MYKVHFHYDGDDYWLAHIPALDGAQVQGRSFEHTVKRVCKKLSESLGKEVTSSQIEEVYDLYKG